MNLKLSAIDIAKSIAIATAAFSKTVSLMMSRCHTLPVCKRFGQDKAVRPNLSGCDQVG
jgi:hypothetical protein